MSKGQAKFWQVGLTLVCAGLVAAGCARQADETKPAAGGTKNAAAQKDQAGKPSMDPETVMVQINEIKLTEGELAKQAAEQYTQVAAMVPPEQADNYHRQMRVQTAQNFIVTSLLEAEAAKRGIKVTDMDVANAIDDITKRIPEGMTLDKVLETENMTVESFKARLKKDLRVKKLFDQEMDKIGAITDQEVAEFYDKQKSAFEMPEQVKARHILVKVDEKDDQTAKAAKKTKIEGLKKQLEAGADFAELAKANSDCPSSKEGGVLPKFGRGQMVPPFEEAAFSQASNAIGPIVETQFGYHIVQVMEKDAGRTRPLREVKTQIVDYLKMIKSRKVIPPFIDALRAAAKITINPALEQEMQAQKLADQAESAEAAPEGEETMTMAPPPPAEANAPAKEAAPAEANAPAKEVAPAKIEAAQPEAPKGDAPTK